MRFLVNFKSETSPQDIDAYLQQNSCVTEKQYDHYEEVYLVTCASIPPVTAIVESVVDDESQPIQLLGLDVDLDPDRKESSFEVNDQNNWWKLASINSPDLDAQTDYYPVRGKGVTVYMMDSGIDMEHPEFADADVTLFHSFTDDFEDTTGHGTALSSVIVGKTCGLTSAHLAVVKIFDKTKATRQSDLLAAFDAIIADVTATGKAAVVNMSWSIPKNEFIESKIKKLIDAGIYAVASAGNSGEEIGNVTPASMDEVLTIGSFGEHFEPSDFSNYTHDSSVTLTEGAVNGGELDGWAPGENVYAAIPGGTYGNVSGTSIAAAIHTGAIAYNLVDILLGNQITPCYAAVTSTMTKHVSGIGFGRRGLLTLSAKYKGSLNLISTYRTHSEDLPVPSLAEFKIRAGAPVCLNLVSSLVVSNVSCDHDLPPGLFMENGLLTGAFEPVTGNYEHVEFELTLTLRAGGLVPYTVKAWVLDPNFDETIPDPVNDPRLNIVQETCPDCCHFTTCAYLGCSGSCFDCNYNPKDRHCVCVGPLSCD